MTTTIQKWGNTRAVRIPKVLAEQLNLNVGQEVELVNADGLLMVRAIRRRKKYKLSELLRGCKGKPHPAIWNKPVGNELI